MVDRTTTHAVHRMPFADAAPSLSVLAEMAREANGWIAINLGSVARISLHRPGKWPAESAPIAVDLCADVWTATEMAACNLLAAIGEPQGRRED